MNNYHVIGYYNKEYESFVLYAPELPGCMADGDTLQEAQENLKEMISEWIDAAKEIDREIPVPYLECVHTNPSVDDVADYIVSKLGRISTLMLQKLTYYCQSWFSAWYSKKLFDGDFQAWARGPVNPDLYREYQHLKVVPSERTVKHSFSDSEIELMNSVMDVYGEEDPDWLSELTHSEDPWTIARKGLPEGAPSNNIIDEKDIERFYKQYELENVV